jgi:hypothetical protein
MKPVLDRVLTTIKKASYKATDLARTREKPFCPTGSQGVMPGASVLGGLAAAQDEPNGRRLRAVQGMAEEKAYYWFRKTTLTMMGRRAQ